MARSSLHAIAAACGVSTATVSRALGSHPAVHHETRALVVAAARRHGYVRNELVGKLMAHVRAGLTQRFLGNLAVIHVPSALQPRLLPAHRQIIVGAAARARALGYELDEFSMTRDGLGPTGYARMLKARGVQGVIFIYTEPTELMAEFPWGDFATIEIDYAQRAPVLHTVCLDHSMSLTNALDQLHTLGYRRMGLFLTRYKDERIAHKWSAAFLAFQHHVRAVGKVPLLILDRVEEGKLIRWHRRHRPDLILGHVDEAVVWLQRAGVSVPEETAFFNLSWAERKRPCAGLDLRFELQGEVAAESLIAQLQRGERGRPADPRTIMVSGRWMDGPTLRGGGTGKRAV